MYTSNGFVSKSLCRSQVARLREQVQETRFASAVKQAFAEVACDNAEKTRHSAEELLAVNQVLRTELRANIAMLKAQL